MEGVDEAGGVGVLVQPGGMFAAHMTHKTETFAMHDLCLAAAHFTSLRLLFYDPEYTHTLPKHPPTHTHTHTYTYQVENNGKLKMGGGKKSGPSNQEIVAIKAKIMRKHSMNLLRHENCKERQLAEL